MTKRAVAYGRAAHAVLMWLNGREVEPITLLRAPSNDDHAGVTDTLLAARNESEVREAIRLALAAPTGEMIYLRRDTSHIDLADPHVERAALLACRLAGARDLIDDLEHELHDVLATLKSPRIWHAVSRLAAALSDHGSLSGATAATVIRGAMLSGSRAKIAQHPRRVIIMPSAPQAPPTKVGKPKLTTAPMTSRDVVATLQTPAQPKRRKLPRAPDRTPQAARRFTRSRAR